MAASALLDKGDYVGADRKYQEAYALSKDPRLIYDMAFCAKNRHLYARMRVLLQRYRQEAGASISTEDATVVERALVALEKFVGTVAVSASVEGATVAVDGEVVGTTPLAVPVVLDPGPHTLVVQKDGYERLERPIDVTAGTKTALAVTLVAQTPATGAPAPAAAAPASTEAPAPEQARGASAGEASGRRWGPLVYSGFGLAAAGVVVGGVTGALAFGKAAAVGDKCHGTDCPTSVDGDLHAGLTLATVSTVSFVAAGVGAAVGVAGLLLAPRRENTPSANGAGAGASVTPWIGLGSAGVRGSF